MQDSRQFGGSPYSNNNSEIMCRICHEGESKEELFSFCKCSGTVAMAHRSCLEKWLSTANSSACEICKYNFQTSRRPRPILDVKLLSILDCNSVLTAFIFSGSVTLTHPKTLTT